MRAVSVVQYAPVMTIDFRATQNPQSKRQVAESAAMLVEDGMLVGLGSGSTAEMFVQALGSRAREGLRVHAVATSQRTESAARAAGITLIELDGPLDLAVDGADAVERETLSAIKGLGGALTREKVVAAAARDFVLIVDTTKVVDRLCDAFDRIPVPIEVLSFGWRMTSRRLANLGRPVLRERDGVPVETDNGNLIVDLYDPSEADPGQLALAIDSITGVVEHGLFLGMATSAIVGSPDDVLRLHRLR